MRFIVRAGDAGGATADGVMLKALGLPDGGVVAVGATHVQVRPGPVARSTDIALGPEALANSGLGVGASVDVRRRVLPPAARVVLAVVPADGATLVHALHGRPVTAGDAVALAAAHLGADAPVTVQLTAVEPEGAGIVGPQTVFVATDAPGDAPAAPAPGPTAGEALLAGLDNEVELLTGWFSLLAGPRDLAAAWGLPAVAGVLLSGPDGCGKRELVGAAAQRAGCEVVEIDVTTVYRAESLLDRLSAAIASADGPTVVLLDRLEAVTGDEAMTTFRSQSAAILRWFLDSVAAEPSLACVLGVSSIAELHPSVSRSPLLPRSITLPPPDVERRRLLFEAACARIPRAEVDHARLAAASAGFSGTDVMAAVVQASAAIAHAGGELTTDGLLEAMRTIPPSLGSVSVGEMTSFGFDRVADLVEVKQRLTEAVIWPVSEPERFERMGIEPPRGVLLHGPPGTGKTFVVKALAHEAGAAFFSVKGAELLDKYVGESERGVRDVFARARAAAPAIVFFDEFDALAPVRGRSTSTVSDSVVAALLTELDGVSERGDVAVIAATNRPDLVDPALLRSGRFETHIELGLPGAEARRAMLDITDVALADGVDLDELADRTDGLSFADIAGMLREAALAALRESDSVRAVDWPHLDHALARFRP